jgi:hypothetical protein
MTIRQLLEAAEENAIVACNDISKALCESEPFRLSVGDRARVREAIRSIRRSVGSIREALAGDRI